MKSTLAVLVVLLFFTAENESKLKEKDVNLNLEDLLREGYISTELDGEKEIVILVGSTGTGKSTLSKFLRRDPSLRTVKNSGRKWIFTDGDETIGGNVLESKTLYSNVYVDEETGVQVVDCAGFEDTRSLDVDLITAFLNKKILDSSKAVKIVIVENFYNLQQNGNRDSFARALRHTANLIGANCDSFNGSIGLVATKVDSRGSDKDVLFEISAFLDEMLEKLGGEKALAEANGDQQKAKELFRQMQLLEFLHQGDNVQLFWRPENFQLESTEGNRVKLRELVFETLSLSKPFNREFEVSVATETVNYINEHLLIKESENKIEKEFANLRDALLRNIGKMVNVNIRPMHKRVSIVIESCTSFLKILDTVHSFEHLKHFSLRRGITKGELFEIRFQVDKEKFLHQVVDKDVGQVEKKFISNLKLTLTTKVKAELDFNSFLHYLINDFGTYEVQSLQAPITQEIETLNVESFGAFASNLPKWGFSGKTILSTQVLNPTETNLEALKILGSELQHTEVKVEEKNTRVIFSGSFLILSKIKDQIIAKSNANEIVMIAGEKIFIDCDLSLQHTHLKLVAPLVEIVGQTTRTFHLRGENGANNMGKAANCVRGGKLNADGAKGNDGFSSGNFTLLALDLFNGHLLKVQMDGGDGGTGQHGGDGCDVKHNEIPTEIYYKHQTLFRIREELCIKLGVTVCNKYDIETNKIGIPTAMWHIIIDSVAATEGGNGGHGGYGARSGDHRLMLRNRQAAKTVQTLAFSGKIGASGQGGRGGKMGRRCTEYMFDCSSFAPEYYTCKHLTASSVFRGVCDDIAHASYGGRLDSLQSGGILRQKFKESNLLEQAFQYFKVVSRQKLRLEADSDAGQFLRFLFYKSDEEIPFVSMQDFHDVIDREESSFGNGENGDFRDTIRGRRFFYNELLQYVRRWRQVSSVGAPATVVDVNLISLLDTLQAFLHDKQVVRLSALVDAQLNRLSDVDKAIEQVGKFEAVATEKQLFLKKITKAEKLMNKINDRKINKLKDQADDEFTDLLKKTEQMKQHYEETDRALVEHQKAVRANMWKNIGLGFLNIASTVAGAFFPPAAALGPTVTGIVNAAAPGPGALQYESRVPKAVQNAKAVFEKLQMQSVAKRESLVAFAKNIMDVERKEKFLSDENKQSIAKILENDATEVNLAASLDFMPLLNAIDEDLDARMASIGENGDTADYNDLKAAVTSTKLISSVTGEVAKTLQQYSSDKSKLNQVEAAIQQNRENLQEMTVYEENLQNTFKPMVDQMVETFDSAGSNLKGQNSFELLFGKMDLKHYARKCVSVVQKMTQDFFAEDEGFASIMIELQELLNTLIDAYDKIEELQYRVQLAEFVGKMSGGKCHLTSDPVGCNSLQNVTQSIKTNQLVREFAQVFTAYQQVSFPFGADKMTLINATHLSLRSAPKERVVELLRSALETIRDDLSASRTTTNNDDTNVILTEFSSKFKSTRPFYIWPNAQFSRPISELLRGEQVTLDASVLATGVKNAVKSNWVALSITSKDENTTRKLENLLQHFHIDMVRSGESYFRCDGSVFALGGVDLNLTMSFEQDEKGNYITRNRVQEKLRMGDVPLSPYVLWKFKLVHASQEDSKVLLKQLELLSEKVDLELVGEGSYVKEGAAICATDLSRAYNYIGL